MYVYAFPVQQTLVFLLYPNINAEQLMIYAFLVTLFIATLSWHFIEKPALNLKNYFNRLKTT
jgi:peptidoglycan/LPS O-acetylase OafA/YrhL